MNAKELILYNINSGSELAACYLHLIMMGMNINDIISFMTSPAVNLISELVSSNIFDEYTYKMNVNDVINILAGRFPLRKFIFGTTEIETENGEETQSNSQKLLNNLFSKMEYKINSFCESIGISSGTEKETI